MMQTNFTAERRIKTRERIEFPLKVIAFANNSEKKIYLAKTVDVSEDGLCLQVPQPMSIKNDFMCIINMGEKEAPEWFAGKPVWTYKCENGYRYGVRLGKERSYSYKVVLDKVRLRSIQPQQRTQPPTQSPTQSQTQSQTKPPTPSISEKAILQVAQYIGISKIELSQIQPLDKQYVHKTDPNQVVISTIYNADEYAYEVEELRLYTVFYAYAFPNLTCPVVFDHPLDHYPMMYFYETARQMTLAIMHLFYRVPLEGYASIVKWTIFNYKVFAELDMPMAIIAVDTAELEIGQDVQRRFFQYFYVQENKVVATMQSEMTSIKKEVYQKLRKSARRSMLLSKFGNVNEVKFVTNLDTVGLFADRNKYI
jgi:hypothetical protein